MNQSFQAIVSVSLTADSNCSGHYLSGTIFFVPRYLTGSLKKSIQTYPVWLAPAKIKMSQKTIHLADENMQLLSDFKNSSRSKFKKIQLPNEKKIWRRLEMNSQFFHYKTIFRL